MFTIAKGTRYDLTMRGRKGPPIDSSASASDKALGIAEPHRRPDRLAEDRQRSDRGVLLREDFTDAVSSLTPRNRDWIEAIIAEERDKATSGGPAPVRRPLDAADRQARTKARKALQATLGENFDRKTWADAVIDLWEAISARPERGDGPPKDEKGFKDEINKDHKHYK